MDNDKLISLVYENKCLWDMNDKNYHNRDFSRQKWEKIAIELDTSSESAKAKWRGLRDTFRKELGKNPKKWSGDEGGGITKECKWTHFKSMEFLKDQFQKRKLQDETLPQSCAAPQKKSAKLNNASAIKKLIMLEEQKLQMFKERNSVSQNEDADYHFLMSLLPYLRKVPEDRKMFVRTKLQQVFCEEDLSGSRGKHTTLQPIHHQTDSLTNDSWTSGSEVETPLNTHHHQDLA